MIVNIKAGGASFLEGWTEEDIARMGRWARDNKNMLTGIDGGGEGQLKGIYEHKGNKYPFRANFHTKTGELKTWFLTD